MRRTAARTRLANTVGGMSVPDHDLGAKSGAPEICFAKRCGHAAGLLSERVGNRCPCQLTGDAEPRVDTVFGAAQQVKPSESLADALSGGRELISLLVPIPADPA